MLCSPSSLILGKEEFFKYIIPMILCVNRAGYGAALFNTISTSASAAKSIPNRSRALCASKHVAFVIITVEDCFYVPLHVFCFLFCLQQFHFFTRFELYFLLSQSILVSLGPHCCCVRLLHKCHTSCMIRGYGSMQ